MKKIKVLHVVVRLGAGGIEQWLINILKTYDNSRFQMDVCCVARRPDLGPFVEDVRQLESKVHYISLGQQASFVLKFRRLLQENGYDVLISHIALSFPVLLVGKLVDVPVRISVNHNTILPGIFHRNKLSSSVLRRGSVWMSTAVTGCSETTLDSLYPRWKTNRKFSVLYYGILTENFLSVSGRAIIRNELRIPVSALVVGHVGRFTPQKNHETFVRVAKVISRSLPDTHFILVGDGPLHSEIEEMVSELDLSHQFHFTGIRRDVPQLLNAMDVTFFPSLYEGSPVTFIEAQVVGLPIVTGKRPEMKEAICPENVIYSLVDIDDHELAARKIIQLLKDNKLRSRIADYGQCWAVERFSIERSTRDLESLIEAQFNYDDYPK